MQHRSTETPSKQAEALKRDALILEILRAGPGDSGGSMIELQDVAELDGGAR